VFGPSTTQVDPDIPYRESRQTTNWHHTEDTSTFHMLHIATDIEQLTTDYAKKWLSLAQIFL